MQRRVFFSGMIVALLCATASLASDYQSSVEAQLRAQGFSDIRVETTWLGRLKITAQRRGAGREIVLNPRNGEILRDIISTQNGAVMPRISDGPVPVLFRSGAHVKRLFVRRPRGFSSPMLNADGAGCKSR